MKCAQKSVKGAYDEADYRGRDRSSDSFLFSVITRQSITGVKGTATIPIKNTELPKEIKNNFPQVKSLAADIDSYEELRKVIILLFSYCFWSEGVPVECDNDDKYDEYTMQLDTLLLEANMPRLYHGNPYDWLFLYCTLSDQSLDTFQGILAQALDDEE